MTKELIINSSAEGVEIALLEDKKLVELHYGRGQDQFAVGDLYLGKIKKLMPRLSCEISLPGRFVVVTPFNDVVAISRKIHSADERKRLQRIVESIKPKNF